MSNPLWRNYVRKLTSVHQGGLTLRTRGANALRFARTRPFAFARLEELESRLAPAVGLTAANQQLLQSYGQLPISFEVNAGQTDAQVQYLAHGSGYGLFLTSTGAVLSLQQSTAAPAKTLGAGVSTPLAAPASVTGVALTMNLVGANPDASVAGQDQLPGTSNYFIGNDPNKWHTNIANYGQVAYQGVYPGVNLVYYGNQQQLEYDFVVAPGADPGSIRLAIQGADNISLDSQGNLVLSTALGNVLEHAPVIYQLVGGARQAIAGQFVLLGQDEVGFQVGTYDASLPLTIDPVLSYSTYLGGSGDDYAYGIAVDGAGNAYVTGFTSSTNFPATTGAFQTRLAGLQNAFVTKLNTSGTALIYSTYFGGNGTEYGEDIAVDGSGNAYVTGFTGSTDFPTTAGAFQTSYGGGGGNFSSDAFVTKLNATGTALVYSTYLGGSGNDGGSSIAVDGAGNVYVTGSTSSTDFPTTAGAFQTAAFQTSYEDVYSNVPFVTELNATGTALVYSTYLGGPDGLNAFGDGIALDVSGNVYVTGSTSSTDFPTTAGAFQTHSGGLDDAFVTELNASGTALIYSTYLGGNGSESGLGIALDSSGNAFITGYTQSTNFPTTPGAFQTKYVGNRSAFVAKFTFVVPPTSHFQVTAPSTATPGTSVTFTVTALDQNNIPTNSGYTGTVHFTSTDGAAKLPIDMMLTNGKGTFSTTFNTPGTQTISATDTTNSGILGTSNLVMVSAVATQLVVSAPTTATAGTSFLATVIAEDGGGHIVSGYSGTVAITSSGGNPVLPPNVTLTNGVGAFLVTMTKTGSSTITATDTVTSTITGPSGTITTSPGAASFFTVTGPFSSLANTGTATPFTVTAYDSSGNQATSYTGTVHFTSSDSNAVLPSDATLTSGIGTFNVNFKTAGNQTVTVTDTVAGNPSITGTTTIKISNLIVTGFTQTPTGFVVTFNQPFIPSDIAQYGAASLVQPVTLVGAKNGNINGTSLFDPTNPTTLTFNATASTLLTLTSITGTAEQVLPDDSYTVTLVSGSAGSNGFQDPLGGLDGAGNGGHANYVTTFTTRYQLVGTPELGIPDFARGPSGATPQAITVPNDTGKGGIPITLYNATNVTDVTVFLTYDPTLLNITGGGTGDSTGTGSSFTYGGPINGINPLTVEFEFHDATPQSGTVVLGDVLANVPNSAKNLYKNKELLQIAGTVNGFITALGANSVHVNAYFGDVNGNGKIDGTDTSIITVVASTNPGSSTGFTGFPAYALLDPIIIGDLPGSGSVDSGSITILNNFNVGLYTSAAQIPIPPGITGIVSPNVIKAAVSLGGTTATPQLTAFALPSDPVNLAADSEQTALIDHVFAQYAKNHKHHRRAGDVSPLILVRRRVS